MIKKPTPVEDERDIMRGGPKRSNSAQPNFIYKASITNKDRKMALNRIKPCAGCG